jgi:hypothetical protein
MRSINARTDAVRQFQRSRRWMQGMSNRFGAWAAVAAALAAVAYDIPLVLQVLGVLTDPWDRILIFAP